MCRVYNIIGALNDIQSHLVKNNLDEFYSLDELIQFEKDYHSTEKQIILNHTLSIQKEKTELEREISELEEAISKKKYKSEEELKQKLNELHRKIDTLFLPNSKIITIPKDIYINLIIWLKIWFSPLAIYFKITFSTYKSNKLLSKKNTRQNFINTNFDEAVKQSSASELNTLERKRITIQEINNSIYGALGEQKVVDELKKLPDDYILINDFSCSFYPAIYNRNGNDYIKSIQIDHILISPSGVFLIETKNWNEHSIKDTSMFSPVKQIQRANFALYKILSNIKLKSHFWGNRKISTRNLIVFINKKPFEEFEYVKILRLNELLNYIKYFSPILSPEETQKITDFLLKKCESKNIVSKLKI